MTRAVIDFSHDISESLPYLSNLIKGSVYDPDKQTMVFLYNDMTVVMEKNKATILGADNEAIAHEVITWAADKMKDN
jgi:hypothetical protein